MHSSASTIFLVWVAMVTIGPVLGERQRSTSSIFPACYINFPYAGFSSFSSCSHPFYTSCQYGVCCGPNHYCCEGNGKCCRRLTWTPYEAVGIITSSFAWAFLIATVVLLLVPRCRRTWRKIKASNILCFKSADVDGKQ